MIEIRACTIAELESADNLDALLTRYAREGSLPELGDPVPQVDIYRLLEQTSVLHPVGAFENGKLVGFIFPLVGPIPHYGATAVTIESFFVRPEERKQGAGLALLAQAESLGRDLGARAILVSAPKGGTLARVLSSKDAYRHSNEVFVRALA